MISEIEETVLKVIMLGERRIDKIAKKCGIPSILVEKILERLIEKGYLDYDLKPLEKAYEDLRWIDKKRFSRNVKEMKGVLRMISDLAIVFATILFILSILQYFKIIYNQFLMIFIYSISMIILITILYILTRGYKIPIFERISVRLKRRETVSRVQEITSQFKKPPYSRVVTVLSLFSTLVFLFLTHKVNFVVVTSDSMVPTFKKGDMFLAQSIYIDPKPGDIVVFKRPFTYIPISHRVLKIEGEKIYTGGDASGPDDWTITKDDIIAEAVMINGKPIVIKDIGSYFILNATELRSVGPYGQTYQFYKNLVNAFKSYSAAIMIIAISLYIYLELKRR